MLSKVGWGTHESESLNILARMAIKREGRGKREMDRQAFPAYLVVWTLSWRLRVCVCWCVSFFYRYQHENHWWGAVDFPEVKTAATETGLHFQTQMLHAAVHITHTKVKICTLCSSVWNLTKHAEARDGPETPHFSSLSSLYSQCNFCSFISFIAYTHKSKWKNNKNKPGI